MTLTEHYLDLKTEFERLDDEAKAQSYALKRLLERLSDPVDRERSLHEIDVMEFGSIHDLIERRKAAWARLKEAWEALPADRQRQLSPPISRRPTTH